MLALRSVRLLLRMNGEKVSGLPRFARNDRIEGAGLPCFARNDRFEVAGLPYFTRNNGFEVSRLPRFARNDGCEVTGLPRFPSVARNDKKRRKARLRVGTRVRFFAGSGQEVGTRVRFLSGSWQEVGTGRNVDCSSCFGRLQ